MKDKKKYIIAGIGAVLLLSIGVFIGTIVANKAEKKPGTAERDYNILDCINVGNYKDLKVSLAVTDEDIDTEIESTLEEQTTYERKDGTVQDGDMIYADIVGYVDNKRADDTCTEDYVIIGSGDWLEGFESSLIGAKTGETAEFDVDVPKGSFGNDEVDGKTVHYKVKVEYICGDEIVPEFNDDFVQSISDECNTTDEYREYLKKELLKENETDKNDMAWNELLDKCKVKKYPEDMMEEAEDTVMQGYYDMAELYGCSKDEVFTSFGYESEEDFRATDLEYLKKDTVKENLLALAMAELENIEYTQEEYDEVLSEEYSYCEDSYSSKDKYEEENKGYVQNIALQNKVKEWLGENLTFITE